MNRFRYTILGALFAFCLSSAAQSQKDYKEMHKVKKKETIFGIANKNGVTVQELIEANPEMNQPGYELKTGTFIFIPYTREEKAAMQKTQTVKKAEQPKTETKPTVDDPRNREIRVGVMLPLHDINGDGRRMVEYYRGLLMAVDSVKREGISVNVHAWNVPIDADIKETLKEPDAARCDIIFGPLYTPMVKALGDFALEHDIKMVIPFSINSDEVFRNKNIFQVYQNPVDLNQTTIERLLDKFSGYHPVFIDCNDATSTKGLFTSTLRRELEQKGIEYHITNLTSSEDAFYKAFSQKKPNLVILNTGRAPELRVALAKLNGMVAAYPSVKVSLFGYTDWVLYTNQNLENFYKFDTYIPSTFYYNPVSSKTKRIEQRYRWAFHEEMMNANPRFAITGFDQGYYFLRGLHQYGKDFYGNTGVNGTFAVQNPYHFKRVSAGGLQNKSFLFIHYKKDRTIETINY